MEEGGEGSEIYHSGAGSHDGDHEEVEGGDGEQHNPFEVLLNRHRKNCECCPCHIDKCQNCQMLVNPDKCLKGQ